MSFWFRKRVASKLVASKKPQVLWVDDDSPHTPRDLAGFHVVPVQSVAAAENLLAKKAIEPKFVIMDLVVPQGDWRSEHYLQVPGIDYIRELNQRYGDDMKIAVFTAFGSKERAEESKRAGATAVFEKTRFGLGDVLATLKATEAAS